MMFLQAVAAFILVLGPLVFIHEFGHFIVAKALKIDVPVFSLGFGPRLFGFTRGGTDYRLSLIPLGGFVRLAGDESDENRSGGPEEFLSRPKYQRLMVFVAGAAFNILLAFLVMWLYFGIYGKHVSEEHYPVVIATLEDSAAQQSGLIRGDTIIEIAGQDIKSADDFRKVFTDEILLLPDTVQPILIERDGERLTLDLQTGADPVQGHGDPGFLLSMAVTPTISVVLPDTPAEGVGLQAGDRILAGNEQQSISEIELRQLIVDHPEESIELEIERGGEVISLSITPRNDDGEGRIGVGFMSAETIVVQLSASEALRESVLWNLDLSKTVFVILKRLVTRELPIKTLSSPIGIAQIAREAFISGIDDILYILAFLSLQLGILNLLPIPVLDGGHILILGIEGVMRRDLSPGLKERVIMVGFIFLLSFMGLIIVYDLMKVT
jgi:regulator of sigma E protease